MLDGLILLKGIQTQRKSTKSKVRSSTSYARKELFYTARCYRKAPKEILCMQHMFANVVVADKLATDSYGIISRHNAL